MSNGKRLLLLLFAVSLSACAPKIYGTVQLLDKNLKSITDESPEGAVINMINTTASIEEASHSVTVDKEGKYESEKKGVKKGTHKVEARMIGYETETKTVEVSGGVQVDFTLKKIIEGQRRSIGGAESDEDKIINPGEVNIRPPSM